MPDLNRINAAIAGLHRFKEMFLVGEFYIQPHVMHLHRLPAGKEAQVHSHQTYEFSILLDGRARYRIEGRDVELPAGDAIIIPPRTQHNWLMRDASLIFGFMLFISCQGDGAR